MPERNDLVPRLHLAAYGLCVDQNGRLLLARIGSGPDAGRWTLPGGRVEWGEHPDDALVRELSEETGIEGVVPGPVLGIYSRVYEQTEERPRAPLHHVGIVYEVAQVSGELRYELDGSTDACGWFTKNEVKELPLVPLADYAVGLASS